MLCRDSACSGMDGTALHQVWYCSDSIIPLFFLGLNPVVSITNNLWVCRQSQQYFFLNIFITISYPLHVLAIYLSILRSYLCYNGYVVPSKLSIVYILVFVLAIFSPLSVCMWWIRFSIILLHIFNINLLH
jgi:hypothetical protein